MIMLAPHEAQVMKKFIARLPVGTVWDSPTIERYWPGELPTFEQLAKQGFLFYHGASHWEDDDGSIVSWGEGYSVTLAGLAAYCQYFLIEPLTMRFTHPVDQERWIEFNK